MTARRSLPRVLALSALLVVVAAPRPARASKADAFEGKVPPIAGQLYQKAGRFELTPTGDLSLNDAFFTKYFVGAKLGYHFTEFLSLSGQFATGTTSTAGSAVVCPANAGCRPASQQDLYQLPGHIDTLAGLELGWSPVYGKLNVFSERVAHFDLSLLVGADWIRYREVLDQASADAGIQPGTEATIGGHVGIGARLFLAEWLALRLEFKDYIYAVRVPPPNSPRVDVQNQLFTELGVSFFLPLRNRPQP